MSYKITCHERESDVVHFRVLCIVEQRMMMKENQLETLQVQYTIVGIRKSLLHSQRVWWNELDSYVAAIMSIVMY